MVLEKSSALGKCRLERAEERVLFRSATSATFPHELTNPVSKSRLTLRSAATGGGRLQRPKRATSTSFKPGQSGNPKGRPPGIKEALPRGAFKAAYDRVLAKDPQLLDTVIRAGLKGQPKARNAVPFLELGAKLGKEIGGNAAEDSRPVIFHFHTNLNPLALSGAVLQQQRSLPAPAAVPLAGAGRAPAVPNAPPSRPSKRAGAKPPGGSP
jgi:hypothetical protein